MTEQAAIFLDYQCEIGNIAEEIRNLQGDLPTQRSLIATLEVAQIQIKNLIEELNRKKR